MREGFDPVGLPDMSVSVSMSGQEGAALETKDWLSGGRLQGEEAALIDRASQLYLMASLELDPLKSFIWAFQSIEAISNEIGTRLAPTALKILKNKPGALSHDRLVPLFSDMKKLSLAAKFAAVAIKLFPDTTIEEFDRFCVIKRWRNKIAHGEIFHPENLPRVETVVFAQKVIFAAFRQILDGKIASWEDHPMALSNHGRPS